MSTAGVCIITLVVLLIAGGLTMYSIGRMHGAMEVRREWSEHSRNLRSVK